MMDIQPIRTKADHKAALKLVSKLVDLDPAPRTPDGDMLDVMSTLVAAYETKHFLCRTCRPDRGDQVPYGPAGLGTARSRTDDRQAYSNERSR